MQRTILKGRHRKNVKLNAVGLLQLWCNFMKTENMRDKCIPTF